MRKRLISLLLIMVLIFSNAATVFADDNFHSNTDADEITTNDSTEVVLEEITTTKDEPNIIDASTLLYRLLIITDNSDIITNGTIISSYDNTYLIGYETEADRQTGYDYYNNIVEFIDYDDNIFEISTEATNTDANEEVDIVNTNDALTNLSTLDKIDIPTSIKKQPIIAVIDSGYNDDNILNSISVVNDDPTDKVGHGSKSVFIVNFYIKLTFEEAAAINCHMGMCGDSNDYSIGDAFRNNPLIYLLHVADMMSTIPYFNEEKTDD